MRVQPCKGLPGPALGRPLERRGSSRRPASRTVPQQPRAHAPGGPSAAVVEAAGHGTRAAAAPSKCPFALAADFMLQDPRPPKLSPLGEVVFSSEPAAVPTPHLWLDAGMSGQDTPGRLVSGLRRLTHVEEWLNQDAGQHASELALKRKGLSSRRQHCFQAEPRSLDAQAECLDAFLEYLPQRYPELYQVKGTGAGRTVSVLSTGETHAVADFAHAPLELCNRIVQEDLVLMRTADEPTAEHRHVMSAASVVFSFGDLDKKLGSPLAFIHAPVPGFEKDLAKLLNKTFDGLQAHAPVWRNNWALVDNGALDNPSYGTPEALASISKILPPETRWLKVEYQTLRRLPATGFILFTIRTFLEPVTVLASYPAAAANLASSLSGMSQPMREYKGLVQPQAQAEMLAYLATLAPTSSAAR